MSPPRLLLDTSTLSEIIKGHNALVTQRARQYLTTSPRLTFSLLTRYEILRGLEAKQATTQLLRFEQQCANSEVLPLTDEIVVLGSRLYGHLHRTGQLISDADILIAATALQHGLALVSENPKHFSRIPGLTILQWR